MQTSTILIGCGCLVAGLLIGYATCFLRNRKKNQRIREYGDGGWEMWKKSEAELTAAHKQYGEWNNKQHQMLLECFQTIRDKNKTIADRKALADRLQNLLNLGVRLNDN